MAKDVDKENICGLIVAIIRVTGKIINFMELVLMHSQMEKNIREIGFTDK